MSRTLQALTILAISSVVILLTMSLSSRGLIFQNSQSIFSTAQADEDEQTDSDNGEHEQSGGEHEQSDCEHEHSGGEHEDSVDNNSSYMHQTPRVQQY